MAYSEFYKRSTHFACLGYYLSETARLEAEIDEFIFAFNEKQRDLASAISKTAPRNIEDKLDFYLDALTLYHPLRREPILADGSLEVNSLIYSILEIFFVRNALAHGAIDLLERGETGVKYTAWRYIRTEKNRFSRRRYSVGSGFLAELWSRGRIYRSYFQNLTRFLQNDECWEREYQADKEIRSNREKLKELAELLGIDVPDFLGVGELELVIQIPKEATRE